MHRRHVFSILDTLFSEKVVALSADYPVWIIDSPLNRPVVHQLWQQSRQGDLSLTIFNNTQDVSIEDKLLGIFLAVDEHHGETSFCSEEAYTRLTVLGLPPTREVEELLADIEFAVCYVFPAGFSAVKREDLSA